MARFKLDRIDQIILTTLAKNARAPFLEIARACGVSGAAIHQRFKKMEKLGIVTGSRILIQPSTLDLNVCAYVAVNLTNIRNYDHIIEQFKQIPEIVECHFVTGKYSILLKLFCFNHDHLLDVIINNIHNVPGVEDTETLISLENTIDRQVWVKDRKEEKGYRKRQDILSGKVVIGEVKPKKKRGRKPKRQILDDSI